MKKQTKRFLIVTGVLGLVGLLVALGIQVFAACGDTELIANVSGSQTAVGTLGTDCLVRFWLVGNGAANNSGTLADASIATGSSGNYKVNSDWGNFGVTGCPNGAGRTAVLYSSANGGNGQYVLVSVNINNGIYWNFDDANGGGACAPVNIPTIATVVAAGPLADNSYDLTITWTPIANLLGYNDTLTSDSNNVITGVAAYRYNGTAAPTNFAKSAWTLASGGPNSRTGYVTFAGVNSSNPDPGTMIVNVPGPIASGTVTYLALSVLFDGATPGDAIRETQFVGPYFNKPIGPTASPLFANVTADPTTVAWTSGDESRVASYQAYMSLTQNGTYRAIGQPVAALGSGHSYTVNYRVVAPTYYVKIKASKTDGTFVWSSPVKVTRLATEPKPLPGKAGLRK
jgi:hypothetical protein